MNKSKKIKFLRKKLISGNVSIGSWMQIGDPNIAEIMGDLDYEWISVDLEHGQINLSTLPDIFRALELKGTLPFVRVSENSEDELKHVFDSGAAGVIIPKIENIEQLKNIHKFCCYPPKGKRGVGFSRTNLFGKNFNTYKKEAQDPIVIAMIETREGIKNLESILNLKIIDAIMVGPYDLSASLGITGNLKNKKLTNSLKKILQLCLKFKIACGIHVVKPEKKELKKAIIQGYQFIAYSGDAFFLNEFARNPILDKSE